MLSYPFDLAQLTECSLLTLTVDETLWSGGRVLTASTKRRISVKFPQRNTFQFLNPAKSYWHQKIWLHVRWLKCGPHPLLTTAFKILIGVCYVFSIHAGLLWIKYIRLEMASLWVMRLEIFIFTGAYWQPISFAQASDHIKQGSASCNPWLTSSLTPQVICSTWSLAWPNYAGWRMMEPPMQLTEFLCQGAARDDASRGTWLHHFPSGTGLTG